MDDNMEKLAAFSDEVTKVVELVTGYKAKMVNNGFSVQTAEVMAADFHRTILTGMLQRHATRSANRKPGPRR